MDIPLDHNFPEPILKSLRDFISEVNLIPLRRIDERLPELDDRRLVIAIHQLGFPGFVTSNYKMLQNPRELAAVIATESCVFAHRGRWARPDSGDRSPPPRPAVSCPGNGGWTARGVLAATT